MPPALSSRTSLEFQGRFCQATACCTWNSKVHVESLGIFTGQLHGMVMELVWVLLEVLVRVLVWV